MTEKRVGDWIQTFTGKQFWPLDARPEEVDIDDIAHALSMLCRFNGHCNRFYSVAEHSVHVSCIVDPVHAKLGLLHDAAEAYVADVARPIKPFIPNFGSIERRLMTVIAARFWLGSITHIDVVLADNEMLFTEKAVLMPNSPAPWSGQVQPLDTRMIQCWSPERARIEFIQRFNTLWMPDKRSFV